MSQAESRAADRPRVWRPGGWLLGARWCFSPNFGPRPASTVVSLVVLHNISLPPGQFSGRWVEAFFQNRLPATVDPYFAQISNLQVSAHFYIRRDGELVQAVGADGRAWHAGQSVWQGRANCNDYSLGIELAGCDELPFTAAQYQTLWHLLAALRERYPLTAVAGHEHVAPGRKSDPGPHFDWAALQRRHPDLSLPGEVVA